MKIVKFSKNKNGMYILTLENGHKTKLHEDLILEYKLLLSKELDEDILPEIASKNRNYEIYEIALKYITVKLRSKKELREYLKKKEYTDLQIDDVIKLLNDQGYLDDVTYTVSFIHDKILLSNYGPNKIKDELSKIGIPSNIIEDKMVVFTEKIEEERINKLIQKQIKTNRNKGASLLKKKIYSYLISLGYSNSVINSCLNKCSFNDEELYQKEYKKIYDKLSKKYSGKELEYRLKQKLYEKGFNNNTN